MHYEYYRFASHSLSRGHFFFARLSVQSPQIVMSGLQGVKPSTLGAFASFFIFALRALSMFVTFAMIRNFFGSRQPCCRPHADAVGSLHI